MNSVFENLVEPLHLFITGAAGIGKSHLVKILTSLLEKLLIYTQEHQIRKNITSFSNWRSCIEY